MANNKPLQVNITPRCCALLQPPNSTRQCSFKSHINGLCNRHYKLSQNKKYHLRTVQDNTEHDQYELCNRVNTYTNDNYHLRAIVCIQSIVRRYIVQSNIYYRGISLYCRHNIKNETDCASFQDIANIDIANLFTYCDQNKLYWGFDIATFRELMKTSSINPYNMLPIHKETLNRFDILIRLLEKTRTVCITHDVITDPGMLIQQRCFDIFQRIDELKYYTQCSWFLDLDLVCLKELYKQLEDIWNYRANLSPSDKFKYSSNGQLFTHNVASINKIVSRRDLSNILLDNFEKLVTHGKEKEDRITGALWILGGLTLVNPYAREALPWLFQSANVE